MIVIYTAALVAGLIVLLAVVYSIRAALAVHREARRVLSDA